MRNARRPREGRGVFQTRARVCPALGKEADDGDHYRLAFDGPGSWSQKYNLVWTKFLLNLFSVGGRAQEMDFYRKTQNEFGPAARQPQEYTKLDWIT